MENRFEQMPEEQGWKAPLPPRPIYTDNEPLISGTQNISDVPSASAGSLYAHTLAGHTGQMETQEALRDNLCAWVREKLSDLLDNDGSVRPEQAAGIYAHLAICRACSQEFEEMQQIVSLVESLPPAELPRDFSLDIMQRIEAQNAVLPHRHLHTVGEVVAPATQTVVHATVAEVKTTTSTTQQMQITGQQTKTNTRQQALMRHKLSRLTLGGILSSMLTYLLSTSWCRQMVNINMSTANNWFGQLGALLRDVPVLTSVVYLIVSALAELGGLLGHTFQTMGSMVAAGLCLDVVICLVAYAVLDARRRQAQLRVY